MRVGAEGERRERQPMAHRAGLGEHWPVHIEELPGAVRICQRSM